MNLIKSRELAAQAWQQPKTSGKVMDPKLADAFATILRFECGERDHHLELAWALIANAGGGDWKRESLEWQEAAAKWRDRYHALVFPRPVKPLESK